VDSGGGCIDAGKKAAGPTDSRHRELLSGSRFLRREKAYTSRDVLARLSTGFEEFTEEDVQRVVEMRMKEDKTYGEIASELNCSTNTVEYVWRSRCRNLVSDEVRESIRRHRRWSPNEEQHLLELQRRGSISIPDAARQFPSKTEGAVRINIMRERLEFPMLKRGPKKRM
jgi:hypothetical protein